MTNEELQRPPTAIEVADLLSGVLGVTTMANIVLRLEFDRELLTPRSIGWRQS